MRLLPILMLLLTSTPLPGTTPTEPAATPRREARDSGLHALFHEAWEFDLAEDPLFATSTGDHRYDDRLPSTTPADIARRAAFGRAILQRLAAIERAALSPTDRVSRDLFEVLWRNRLEDHAFGAWRLPITSDSGFHTELARLPDLVPLVTLADYENYLSRLRRLPTWFMQNTELLRLGLKDGFTMPRVVLEGYDGTMAAHIVDDVESSVFWAPFTSFGPGVPAAEHERLRAAGREAIAGSVIPAYRALVAFFRDEYLPGARTTIAAAALPDGPAYYDALVRQYTTLELTPAAVHDTGRREVARIRAEMDEVIKTVGWIGDFPSFLEHLRTDPRFTARSEAELLQRAAWLAKKMDGKLPSLFGRLPRQPYGVEPVPAHLAPKYTAGRYVEAPSDSTRAGTYWVNTHDLASRPLHTLEALTLHEAVPGHHLQIALTRELEDLPPFRRYAYVTAFGEGWGLYAERLGLEAGFYTDPYSNFGRLTYEMWRACRLVVDTGIHAMGWSRQQAIDFMAANTALSRHEITTEVDRYISWPGQALAYKTGELKIRELRRRAEEALGERFDVRAFHDAVLAQGTVPLAILEEQIDAFIAARRPDVPIARSAP